MIELDRVGGGVLGLDCLRAAGRDSERGFGRLGLLSPAPRGTRWTVGRGVREDEEVDEVDESVVVDDADEPDAYPLPGRTVLEDKDVDEEELLSSGDRAPLDVGVEAIGVDKGDSSSRTIMSGSECSEAPDEESESLVRSITSSRTLSLAAFSTSCRARAPEAQALSSRALRSAACNESESE